MIKFCHHTQFMFLTLWAPDQSTIFLFIIYLFFPPNHPSYWCGLVSFLQLKELEKDRREMLGTSVEMRRCSTTTSTEMAGEIMVSHCYPTAHRAARRNSVDSVFREFYLVRWQQQKKVLIEIDINIINGHSKGWMTSSRCDPSAAVVRGSGSLHCASPYTFQWWWLNGQTTFCPTD